MITKTNEKWVAKTEFPDCNVKFEAESKEELKELIVKDFKAHQRIYESRKGDVIEDFCIYCMTKLIILLDELENCTIN